MRSHNYLSLVIGGIDGDSAAHCRHLTGGFLKCVVATTNCLIFARALFVEVSVGQRPSSSFSVPT